MRDSDLFSFLFLNAMETVKLWSWEPQIIKRNCSVKCIVVWAYTFFCCFVSLGFFEYIPFFYQNNLSLKEVKGYEQQTVSYRVTMRNNKPVQWAHILLFILAVAKITETKHQFRVFAASEDVVYALLAIVWWLKMAPFQSFMIFFFPGLRNLFVVNTCKHLSDDNEVYFH